MRRRELVASVASLGLTWFIPPLPTNAQQAKARTIGVLLVGGREPLASQLEAGLHEVGYTLGQDVYVEYRSAGGKLTALDALASELVRLNVDVIIASETPAVHAAKRSTTLIPIVMAPAGDPVGTGLVDSLARPGGNVTGLSAATAELAGKSLDVLREILPDMRRVAALADPTNPFTKPFLEQIRLAARRSALEIYEALVRNTDEFEAQFAQMKQRQVEAVVVQPTLPRKPAVELALRHRLPSVSGNRAFPDAGGLMSYAASLTDRYRNAAVYVDRILKGAKPSELPVQQPVKFELVVNLKTARALGLGIPPTLLARADDVIE